MFREEGHVKECKIERADKGSSRNYSRALSTHRKPVLRNYSALRSRVSAFGSRFALPGIVSLA